MSTIKITDLFSNSESYVTKLADNNLLGILGSIVMVLEDGEASTYICSNCIPNPFSNINMLSF